VQQNKKAQGSQNTEEKTYAEDVDPIGNGDRDIGKFTGN
jgi:hypothetical protein